MDISKEFAAIVQLKTTWSSKELEKEFERINNGLKILLSNVKPAQISKITTVDILKKYDIIYISVAGSIPHYFMVYKCIENIVYGVIITSKDKDFVIHEITHDRFFKGNYASNLFSTVSLDIAINSFNRVYESKKEADIIFNKIKDNIRKSLDL